MVLLSTYLIGTFIALVNLSCGGETSNSKAMTNQLFSIAKETISTHSKNGRVVSEIDKKEYKRVVLLASVDIALRRQRDQFCGARCVNT